MDDIARSGPIYPTGNPIPRHARSDDRGPGEDFAAAIVYDLVLAWRDGRLYEFTEAYLSNAVRNFIRTHHQEAHQERHAPQDPDQLGARDDEESVIDSLMVRDQLGTLFNRLDPETAYLLGWILAKGERHGEQGKAAYAIGKSDSWATNIWNRIREEARLMQRREDQSPRRSPARHGRGRKNAGGSGDPSESPAGGMP